MFGCQKKQPKEESTREAFGFSSRTMVHPSTTERLRKGQERDSTNLLFGMRMKRMDVRFLLMIEPFSQYMRINLERHLCMHGSAVACPETWRNLKPYGGATLIPTPSITRTMRPHLSISGGEAPHKTFMSGSLCSTLDRNI